LSDQQKTDDSVQRFIFTLKNPYSDSAGNSRSGQTKANCNRLLCHHRPLIGCTGCDIAVFTSCNAKTSKFFIMGTGQRNDSDANDIAVGNSTTEWHFTVKEVNGFEIADEMVDLANPIWQKSDRFTNLSLFQDMTRTNDR
jgi:hypothetical protein